MCSYKIILTIKYGVMTSLHLIITWHFFGKILPSSTFWKYLYIHVYEKFYNLNGGYQIQVINLYMMLNIAFIEWVLLGRYVNNLESGFFLEEVNAFWFPNLWGRLDGVSCCLLPVLHGVFSHKPVVLLCSFGFIFFLKTIHNQTKVLLQTIILHI